MKRFHLLTFALVLTLFACTNSPNGGGGQNLDAPVKVGEVNDGVAEVVPDILEILSGKLTQGTNFQKAWIEENNKGELVLFGQLQIGQIVWK